MANTNRSAHGCDSAYSWEGMVRALVEVDRYLGSHCRAHDDFAMWRTVAEAKPPEWS